jgi:hypothetical protein
MRRGPGLGGAAPMCWRSKPAGRAAYTGELASLSELIADKASAFASR